MMKKAAVIAAVLLIPVLLYGLDFFGMNKQGQSGETPEHIFNMANEAVTKGNSVEAIDLYYKLIEKHPEFREYRADALYRLATLLYKAERYEEAEKIFQMLANKYRNFPQLRVVYEKLLYIYVRELRDEKRAKKIREIYEKKFGKSKVLEAADKTEQILNASAAGASEILKMDPPNIGVISVEESDSYDAEFFPVKCSINTVSASPDKKFVMERKKKDGKYFLYMSGAVKKTGRMAGTKNGFAPQWSWNNRFVAFTAMDWGLKERQIKIYDVDKGSIKNLFAAPDIGPLVCVSPDASLVAFWYLDGLWLANRSGISMVLITNKVKSAGVFMMAWSREGDKLLVGRKVKGAERYYICSLGRKEFIIVK